MSETVVVERERMTVWSFLKAAFKVVIGFSLLVQSLLFLVLLAMIFSVIGSVTSQMAGKKDGANVLIEDGIALVLDPEGVLSETAPEPDPFEQGLAAVFGGEPGPVSVHELVRVVRAAQEDDRIEALVLDLGGLYVPTIYASKAYDLAAAIEDFRESGKRVVALGDLYTQEQYLIASEADTVLMHDYGSVFVLGYGSYRNYYKSALDRLKVNGHVFRVGTFKSALEPYLRDDMSEAARLANSAFLGALWSRYVETVGENRGIGAAAVDAFAQDMPGALEAAGGDMAAMAEQVGLVDAIMSRADQIAYVAEIVGEDEEGGFRGASWTKYRNAVKKPHDRRGVGNVAVVTASGAIVDGSSQGQGTAAGDDIAAQLREAREDEDVKAVVLRVDSPGGSAFASEVMRDEVLKLKAAGKPVMVSMGSLAASGGYWISANADRIFASPSTVTGSIGIFGFVPTFENSLAELGVYTDGVGTTPLSGFTATGLGPLPEQGATILQMSIEEGYDRFLTIVSEGRGMTKPEVDQVAQGRVWIGSAAIELGLVDEMGGLEDAAAAAAEAAGLEDYDLVGMTEPKSAFELFLEGLSGNARADAEEETRLFAATAGRAGPLKTLTKAMVDEARYQAQFNDPHAVYVRCEVCEVR